MIKEKDKKEKTDFQGAISLDAILAATTKKTTDVKIEDKKVIVPQQVVEEEEEEEVVTINQNSTVEDTEDKNDLPVTTPTQNNTEETEFFKTAKRLIALGLLDDFVVQVSEEDEEGTLISQFTGMSEENLKEIVDIHKQEGKNNISTNYISKEGLREHELKVIEILKKGGDLSKIAKTEEEAFQRPFEGFDLDDRERQIDVLYIDLVNQKGITSEKAIALIKLSEQNGTLKEEAQEIFDNYRTAHSNYIDKILEEQNKEKEFKDLNFKENKKALTAKLKEAGLKESVYKKIASEYGKKNESGDYALIDKLKEALDNPEANHELILHLADKDTFNEIFKIKAAQESQKHIVRLASSAASKGNKQTIKANSTEVVSPWDKAAQAYNESIKQ